MAIDLGTRRVGVAVSSSRILASPHSVVQHPGSEQALLEVLTKLADEVEATEIVLGVPAGRRHDAASIRDRFEAFAEKLRQQSCKEVVLWDESYSTTEAASQARETGTSRKKQRGRIDMDAAAVILQSYLDALRRKS